MAKTEYRVVCPHCGQEFNEKDRFCPNCDTPNRKMICRSCGTQINARDAVCRECGARNKKKVSPAGKAAIVAIPVAAIVLAAVLLVPHKEADNASPEPVATSASEPEKSTEQDTVGTQTTPISAEKTWINRVELTIPADFLDEGTTQETLDAEVNEADGFISATLNEDGSVTYVMTEARHNDLMQELSSNIDTELANLASSSDYPNITAVTASDNYTSFTVTLSTDTVGLQESILAMAFYMYGGMYNAFNGTPVDNVTIRYVDQAGNLIQEANSRDMQQS